MRVHRALGLRVHWARYFTKERFPPPKPRYPFTAYRTSSDPKERGAFLGSVYNEAQWEAFLKMLDEDPTFNPDLADYVDWKVVFEGCLGDLRGTDPDTLPSPRNMVDCVKANEMVARSGVFGKPEDIELIEEMNRALEEANRIIEAALNAGLKANEILARLPSLGEVLKRRERSEIRKLREEVKRLQELLQQKQREETPRDRLSRLIHTLAYANELGAEQVQLLMNFMDEYLARNLPEDEIRRRLEGHIEELKQEAERKKEREREREVPRRPPRLEGLFLAPFGFVRVKRIVIPRELPVVCSAVKHFSHFDDARQEALREKQQDPKGLYGYYFDHNKRAWAKVVCTQMPSDAGLDKDGLLYFIPVEKYVREKFFF